MAIPDQYLTNASSVYSAQNFENAIAASECFNDMNVETSPVEMASNNTRSCYNIHEKYTYFTVYKAQKYKLRLFQLLSIAQFEFDYNLEIVI